MNYRRGFEKEIGRKLQRNEIIHHKDFDSCNNSMSNLEVVSIEQHRLIHSKDKKKWDVSIDIKQTIEKLGEMREDDFAKDIGIFFTNRQQAILFKKLNKKQLSKTETEYYSRTIKPKIRALANVSLYNMACLMRH